MLTLSLLESLGVRCPIRNTYATASSSCTQGHDTSPCAHHRLPSREALPDSMACGGPPCAFLPTASGARDNAAIDFEDGQKGGQEAEAGRCEEQEAAADSTRIFLRLQKCLTPRALQPFPLLLRFRARPTFNRASPLAIASSEASVREIRLLRRGLSAADRPRSRFACLWSSACVATHRQGLGISGVTEDVRRYVHDAFEPLLFPRL